MRPDLVSDAPSQVYLPLLDGSNYWVNGNSPNSWIHLDFKTPVIALTHYALKSGRNINQLLRQWELRPWMAHTLRNSLRILPDRVVNLIRLDPVKQVSLILRDRRTSRSNLTNGDRFL